ncbi:MAG: class I SAM-dependent methyltransferase [Saprospiraceae bacterium]|nr:class I SAM-dependent methyltransferase [Saprospiraceae bacterium]
MNTLLPIEVQKYSERYTDVALDILEELERETYLTMLAPNMISGKVQGQLLKMVVSMLSPKKILEIGTYTGYAALAMIAGAPADCQLHTIEVNEELKPIIMKYFLKSGFDAQLNLHIADAKEIIPTLPSDFDLVFIDAEKNMYAQYLELVFPKLRQGGYIIVDNVLWKGKVLLANKDKKTAAIQEFNDSVNADVRFEKILLPIRDGLFILRKK